MAKDAMDEHLEDMQLADDVVDCPFCDGYGFIVSQEAIDACPEDQVIAGGPVCGECHGTAKIPAWG